MKLIKEEFETFACVNTNREFIGFELMHSYFEIAKARIEQAQTAKETPNKGVVA